MRSQDDGDALVFGAPLVIRNSPSLFSSGYKQPQRVALPSQPSQTGVRSSFPPVDPNSRFACTLFSLQRIRTKLGLDADALLLVALASGSDYTPAGLPGLGPQHTLSLISLGLARKLFEGLRARKYAEQEQRMEFARCWREAAASALEREQDVVGSVQAELAQRVRSAEGFPSEIIIRAWREPVVVPREERRPVVWDRELDLGRIVRWCVEQLDWSEEDVRGLPMFSRVLKAD